jgi:hypothetical protein
MDPTAQFIAEIDAFLERSGMTPTVFGKTALKDPNFVGDLKKKGRQPTLGVVGRVHEFIRANDRAPSEQAGAA